MHQLTRAARRDSAHPRLSWTRALPLLVRPATRTMPWLTLVTGCLAGTAYLAILAHVAVTSRSPLGPGAVRLSWLPVVAALAFVGRTPFRPLTQATPVPAWVAPAGHLLLAAPVLAATCWVQLRIAADTVPAHILGQPAAVYPVIAQLTGWSAATVAAAAWVDRSRYPDLGGAMAAPAALGAIALGWYLPASARYLVDPPATTRNLTIAWYAIASAALILTSVAMRDRWHRYGRILKATGRPPGPLFITSRAPDDPATSQPGSVRPGLRLLREDNEIT